MCGGGGEVPQLPPTPAPAPVPSVPSSVNPVATEGQRAAKVTQLKKGILSTIKTSPAGVSGTGADLTTQENSGQKKTLGGG